MHMADALLSPTVGVAAWGAAATLLAISAHGVRHSDDERIVPLMGVLGAFVFAAQMINFAIPGTGSSGHIGGGLLLAILLGPHAAFTVIASILTVQALLFADGGLLALGANIVNLGLFPCYIAYPLIYRWIAKPGASDARVSMAAVLATVVGLQLGAFAVVAETSLSGISSLPFGAFLLLMQPIHLVIGLIEGVATAAVVILVRRARPDLLAAPDPARPLRKVLVATTAAAMLVAGGLSAWASGLPDGLEWSIERVAGHALNQGKASAAHEKLAQLQGATALMPDYDATPVLAGLASPDQAGSLAGLIGGALTLLLVAALATMLRLRARRRAA